jgi:hypothetical protein
MDLRSDDALQMDRDNPVPNRWLLLFCCLGNRGRQQVTMSDGLLFDAFYY